MGSTAKHVVVITIPIIFVLTYIWARYATGPALVGIQMHYGFMPRNIHTEHPLTIETTASTPSTPVVKLQLPSLAVNTNSTTSDCTPHTKIVFVKTHKTAGTSVYFAIMKHIKRYHGKSQKHFPKPFVGGYPGHFDSRFLISDNGLKIGRNVNRPEVIAAHMRFNKPALEELMPHGTKYITIMRNPADALYSTFMFYYGKSKHKSMVQKRARCYHSPFVDLLGKFNVSFNQYLKIASTKLNSSIPWYFRSMNYQSHDLGLDPTITDEQYISHQIHQLESTFNLVMIAEYFLESLILLKKELCMDWTYITSNFVNRGNYERPTFTLEQLSSIKNLQNQDYALYSHFNRTLWKKIDAFGRARMAAEVKKIRSSPTPKKKEKNVELSEIPDLEEDLSAYYSANTANKLASRIAYDYKFEPTNPKVKDMAEYMLLNSGGCNF